MQNGVIDFESVQGESYTLYISGNNKGQITPETDISSHFIAGTNEITVVTDGGEGILASGESNILTVVKHSKIMDLEISEDGTVSFSSRYGFEYELTADGNERGKVKNSDNISSILDELTAGAHRISVKILATGSNCFVDGADEYGNAVEVNKLSAPAAPRVAANKIIFTEVAGETYELFTDNKLAGEIKSGASIVPFYTQNVNMQIALRANKKGFWASDVGAVTTVSVPEKYRAIKGTAQVSYEQSFVYSDKTRLAGAKLSGKTGDTACAEDWTVPFSGSLLKFGYCSLAGSCRMENFAVVVTDVTTDKVLKIIFTSNDDSRRTDSVYVSFEYNGTTSKIYLLTSDMSDSGTGYWGGPQKRIVEIVKTSAGLDFTGTFTDGGWYEIHPEQPDLTGFGQDGVTIGFEFISTETEGNSVIVESIGSHSFLFDVYGEYESAEGQTFTYSDGSAVSGRKITVAENGTTVRIVDEGSITAGGELAKIGFCNVNGNNTIEVFSLIFTSITDPDDKLTVTFNVGNAKASGRVYIKYAYRDAVSEERIVSMDVTDSGNNATFPGQPRFINLFYKSASSSDGSGTLYDLAYNGFTDAWVYGYNGLDLSSLVASGVYADIRFDSITAPSSVIINNIAGNSFVAAQ